jgi:hypothetical protein
MFAINNIVNVSLQLCTCHRIFKYRTNLLFVVIYHKELPFVIILFLAFGGPTLEKYGNISSDAFQLFVP